MPTLPTIQLQEQAPRVQLPDVGVPGAAFVGRGLDVLSQGFQEAQLQQDELDIKLQAVKLDTRMDELREEIKAEPDFAQRDKLFQDKSAEYLANAQTEIQSPRVRQRLAAYYSVKFPREALRTRVENQKEWGFSRVAQTDALGDVIADKVISTTDPQEAGKYKEMYRSQLQALSEGPYSPLRPDQAQNMMQAWENKVTLKRADAQIRTNPTAFLVDQAAGKYPEFDLDTSIKLGEKARKQLDDQEKITERNTKKIKDKVDDEWSAKANFGQLDPAELDKALKNEHPYISPDRARTLKNINENPPTAKGNQAAMTTWSQYLSGSKDSRRIEKTRAELNRIQADIGAPNKYIMDRLNELQNDEGEMRRQAISQQANDIAAQNRGIASEINQYRADKAPIPDFVQKFRGNTTVQDEAKIKAMYQKEGAEAAQKLREKLSKGAVSTYQATPPKMKSVQEYGE